MWREHAEPLAAYLHEVAAIDEEINNANRLKLGPWLDRTETVARPGVGDVDTHKIVGMHTRIPPWEHDEHRSGALLWPPQAERLDTAPLVPQPLRQLEEAVAAEAREATKIASSLRSEPSRARSAPQGIGWLMVTTDTAALRAAAQALTDAVEDDERRSGGLLSRTTLRRSAELRRLLLETRVEQIITERRRAPRAEPGLKWRRPQRQRSAARARKGEGPFLEPRRERRLAAARIIASDGS